MARWQRDRAMRRRVAWALVAAEVLALAACFALMFVAYLRFGIVKLVGRPTEYLLFTLPPYITAGVTLLVVAAALYQGLVFVRGRRWARGAFVVENVLLVALGALWFVKNRITGDTLNTEAALYGLLLPMLTLFPLLWPLLVFSPTPDENSEVRSP